MKCSLVQYLSTDVYYKSELINKLSSQMESYFEGKDYGLGLKEIVIGIVSVSPQFEPFFKIGKPKYTVDKVKRKVDIEIEVEKTLEYRIKVDYGTFKNANDEESISFLIESILGSLGVFKAVKIPDFDDEVFLADLRKFFQKIHGIES